MEREWTHPASPQKREVLPFGRISNLHEHVTVSHLAFPHLCSFALSPARSILQSDVPTMPTADHLARLHDSLTQGKSEVRTKILYGVNAAVPSEQRNVQTLDFHGVA